MYHPPGHTIFNKLFILPSRRKIKQVYFKNRAQNTCLRVFARSFTHSLTHSLGRHIRVIQFHSQQTTSPVRIILFFFFFSLNLPRITLHKPQHHPRGRNLSGTRRAGITGPLPPVTQRSRGRECLLRWLGANSSLVSSALSSAPPLHNAIFPGEDDDDDHRTSSCQTENTGMIG